MKNFVVYKSGAGSGKTFTLVKEYLRLALQDPARLQQNYKRILALTFTNKAAAEMKSRVVRALDELANNTQLSETGRLLCEELKISASEIKRRAAAVLNHLLHHYSDFAIGTIDSFTHRIVRTFAQELDLPMNFNVELDAEAFYEKVVSQLLTKVGEDAMVSRLLKEYVLGRAEENAAWDPEKSIREFASLLLKENSGEYLDKLRQLSNEALEKIRGQLKEFTQYYRNTLKNKGEEALALIAKHQLSDDDFTYKSTGPQSFFKKCAKGEAGLDEAASSRLQAAIENNKWHGKGERQDAVMQLTPELNRLARWLIEFIGQNHAHYSLCELLSKQMHALMLLRTIEEISTQQKEEERIVFISEFNGRIFDLINEEPAPFIYERLGERYHHFLLDEFQDTSSLQFQNLLPLLDNALASGRYNLVVGDGKQSIYRWRNANVRQFAGLPSLQQNVSNPFIAERQATLERNFEEKVLNTNYRSTATIVSFNNSLFSRLQQLIVSPDLAGIYAAHHQTVSNHSEGYVSIHSGTFLSDEIETLNIELVRKHISQAVASGYNFSDIAILCRKNSHGNLIANELVQNDIPVVSSDSLLLRNNLEVNTILSYLRVLANPADQVSAASVITYLFYAQRLDSEELDQLLGQLGRGISLSDILSTIGIAPENPGKLSNIAEHCLNIIKALRLHKSAHQYVRFFLDEVNDFLVNKGPGISAFLEWWEGRKNKASLIIPSDTNAVRIMTIHASKGLEFPVVIIPYCNWQVQRQTKTWVHVNSEKVQLPVGVINLGKKAEASGFGQETDQEQQEQILDNLNLLYVAATRAVNRLHIICARSKGQNSELVSDWVDAYVTEAAGGYSNGLFETGKQHPKKNDRDKETLPIFELQALQFDDTEDVIQIKRTAELLLPGKSEGARTHGMLVHKLLAEINEAGDVEKTVGNAFSEGLIPEDDVNTLTDKLKKIIRHKELRSYFETGVDVKREAELITAAGKLLRPDRVILQNDEATVIDYKTGKEDPRSHEAQLNEYEQALLEMGYKKIKKYLVYISEEKVIEVK